MKKSCAILASSFLLSCGSEKLSGDLEPYWGKIYIGDSKSNSLIRNDSAPIRSDSKQFDKMFCVSDKDFEDLIKPYVNK